MTKTFIITGAVLGAVLVAGVILSLVAPKRIVVRNSTFVMASKQAVFDQLRFMKNFPGWSPFRVQDPEQKFSISGTDGQVGATFSWEGVKEKSKGSQKIVFIKGNDQVKLHCNITEPFQSDPTFNYLLTEKNGGVEVVQDFDLTLPAPANILGLLFGLKNKISATNKQGLSLLKQAAEKNQTALFTNK
ncbi:MAG: hypothetical protein H7X88_12405 [Gloeobacteraceae cyanobacterium ES-bin-316]|nr:hypothetical protein [Ferruginibacter sp.]